MKELNDVDSNNIMSPRLSKSYLKILGILYFIENTNLFVSSDIIKRMIKSIHIFDNVVLVFHPCVIKASPKSDIAVVWVNIWSSQTGIKEKCFINRCFNIEYHIVTIREISMNLDVP